MHPSILKIVNDIERASTSTFWISLDNLRKTSIASDKSSRVLVVNGSVQYI